MSPGYISLRSMDETRRPVAILPPHFFFSREPSCRYSAITETPWNGDGGTAQFNGSVYTTLTKWIPYPNTS